MENFHRKYIRVNHWYQSAEFKLIEVYVIQTDILGFYYEDAYVRLDEEGLLTIKVGYKFGASGPTWDTKSSREGSCVHDALYWISQQGGFGREDNEHIREQADHLILYLCLTNGMYRWRANLWHKVLRVRGSKAWNKRNHKK